MTIRASLLALQTRMESTLEDAWFFPELDGVAGFLGTGPVMIIGSRPAMASVALGGNERFRNYYRLLRELGLSNSHLSDLAKGRRPVAKLTEEELRANWDLLKEEIEIVSPKVIVALGRDVLDPLAARLDRILPLWRVNHYADRFHPDWFERDIRRFADVWSRY